MPRITSGTAKNRKIKVPSIEDIRVAQDVYKLALFSIIGDKILEAECLDLYAGSGSFGIEALSRGAKHCDFVDIHKKSTLVIMDNLKNCNLDDKAEVFQDNSVKFVANTMNHYDLIFVDPFFKEHKHKFLMQNLEEVLNDNGLIAFSHGRDLDVQEQLSNTSLKIITQRKFGKSFLTIISK